MKHIKLHTRDIKAYRDKQLKKQGGICPLCEREIPQGKATLDHDHSSKYIRMVLCMACNRSESIVKTFKRYGLTEDVIPVFLSNIIEYWGRNWEQYSGIIHPKELTEDEKELKRLKKLKKTVKKQETKDQYDKKIKELQQVIDKSIKFWSEK